MRKLTEGGTMNLERIKFYRNRIGYSQNQLGKILGVSKSTLSRWETGEETIPLKHLINFCNYAQINLDYILGLSDKKITIKKKIILDKKSIGQKMILLRKKENLTQNDVAKILNTTQSTISSYENGKTTLLTAFLYDLCVRYKVSADWFCDSNEF